MNLQHHISDSEMSLESSWMTMQMGCWMTWGPSGQKNGLAGTTTMQLHLLQQGHMDACYRGLQRPQMTDERYCEEGLKLC